MTQVSIDRIGQVGLVTMANPPMGYMNSGTARELAAAMDQFEGDPVIRAIVFTGGLPGIFIRHYDVAEIVAMAKALRRSEGGVPDAKDMPVQALFNRVEACPKPTIAAINGLCMGGGYEFALCCDIRLAGGGDYTIGLPEIRVGIFPGGGGTQRLARTIGQAAALDAILRGRIFSPREAAARGFVHEFVMGDVVAEALRIAATLASRPPQAVAAAKRLVRAASTTPLEQGLEDEWQTFAGLLNGDSGAVEIMQDFVTLGAQLDGT